MSNSKLRAPLDIISMEQNTSVFSSAGTLSDNCFSPPSNVGDVIVYPDEACHWHPTGTPTSSFGHAVEANEPFRIPASQVANAQIIEDGSGGMTVTVAYMRGSRRQDTSPGSALTRPY